MVPEFPETVLASMELSGRPITTRKDFYDSADWRTLQTAMKNATISERHLLRLLRLKSE
jgi:hypothetical protein